MELNDIFYESDYSKAFEYVQAHEFTTIKEIEADEGGRRFQLVQWAISQKSKYEDEMYQLTSWFDCDYARKEQKYTRLIAMGSADTDGSDPQAKLTALYETAETNRARIKELETLIENCTD